MRRVGILAALLVTTGFGLPAQAQDESHGILPFGRAPTPAGIQTEDGIGNAA